jgi:GMP synthase-like glutamine amidotransferase
MVNNIPIITLNRMKRIAIIDNTSSHIKKLQSLVSEYDTTTIPYGDCSRFDFSRFDLIILSGGREYSLIGNEISGFGSEIELIKKINRPIIGVCFGCPTDCLCL